MTARRSLEGLATQLKECGAQHRHGHSPHPTLPSRRSPGGSPSGVGAHSSGEKLLLSKPGREERLRIASATTRPALGASSRWISFHKARRTNAETLSSRCAAARLTRECSSGSSLRNSATVGPGCSSTKKHLHTYIYRRTAVLDREGSGGSSPGWDRLRSLTPDSSWSRQPRVWNTPNFVFSLGERDHKRRT
jgi:hypothetical protein